MARQKVKKEKKVDDNSSFFGVSVKRLKTMNVERKFTFTFVRLLTIMLVAAGIMFGIIIFLMYGLFRLYGTDYTISQRTGEMRYHTQAAKAILLDGMNAAPDVRRAKGDEAKEHIIQVTVIAEELQKIYTDPAELQAVIDQFTAMSQVGEPMLVMFASEATAEECRTFYDEQFIPQLDAFDNLVEELNANAAAATARTFRISITVAIVLIVCSLLLAIIAIVFLVRAATILAASILKPVREIDTAAEEMAKGNLDVSITYESGDEFGALASSMRNMSSVLHEVIKDLTEVLTILGAGDLVTESSNPDCYIGDFVPLSEEVTKFRGILKDTIGSIKNASGQVSYGATNMSQGAQDLAEGATDQSASVQELTASVSTVVGQTKLLSESVDNGARVANNVKSSTDEGAQKMNEVVAAMNRISEASGQIANISDTIADIAAQTNLLSLNASIEAARAGQSGKGFAVVADEIRQLAGESAEAAAQTKELIDSTIEYVSHGSQVVDEANTALQKVTDGIAEIQQIMTQNAEVAAQQATAMNEIDKGIEQISQVVQSNAASAEESSAISQELNTQSDRLNELVEQFAI